MPEFGIILPYMDVQLPLNQFRTLRPLGIVLFLLCIIGVIMVYSSSYIFSQENLGDSSYFFKKQLFFLFLGIGASYFISKIEFTRILRASYLIHIIGLVSLVMCFLPGLGIEVKGSSRWLNLGFISLQPGEFLKVSFILVSIQYFLRFYEMDIRERLIKAGVIVSPLLLFLLQPDFGTFVICSITAMFCAYLSPFPRKYFYSILAMGGMSVIALIFAAPYRMQRLMTFLDPWKDPRHTGFQIIQSFLAFANGSFWGKGIGNSNEKLFYLPEAHNDFIFSVIGEELGFVGIVFIVCLFLALLYFGLKTAFQARATISAYFISSFVFVVTLQATLNMGVVLGLLPTKGLNLPFISYGGSSLLANFIGIGICLSALHLERDPEKSYNPLSRRFE